MKLARSSIMLVSGTSLRFHELSFSLFFKLPWGFVTIDKRENEERTITMVIGGQRGGSENFVLYL